MSFNVVFFLMATILITLAFYSKIFRRKELQSMKLETNYFEALKRVKTGALDKTSLFQAGSTYFNNLGLTPEEAKKRIEKDLTLVNSLI